MREYAKFCHSLDRRSFVFNKLAPGMMNAVDFYHATHTRADLECMENALMQAAFWSQSEPL